MCHSGKRKGAHEDLKLFPLDGEAELCDCARLLEHDIREGHPGRLDHFDTGCEPVITASLEREEHLLLEKREALSFKNERAESGESEDGPSEEVEGR